MLMSNLSYVMGQVIPRLFDCFTSHGYPQCDHLLMVSLAPVLSLSLSPVSNPLMVGERPLLHLSLLSASCSKTLGNEPFSPSLPPSLSPSLPPSLSPGPRGSWIS